MTVILEMLMTISTRIMMTITNYDEYDNQQHNDDNHDMNDDDIMTKLL